MPTDAALAPIGRVVATEDAPSSSHQFHFHTAPDTAVGVGTLVRVDGADNRVVYAVIVDGRAYNAKDANSPSAYPPIRSSDEIRIWTANVLRQVPEEPVQPVPLADVRVATEQDVTVALRMDGYARGERSSGIPVGLYSAGGVTSPIYLDADFLLGPESAHLNINGISGLATKTSAVEFILSAIFQHSPAHKGRVAAVCFNVKGPDLCFLDQPCQLSDVEREMYQKLRIEPRPFERVSYFAPHRPDGVNLNTLRSHPDLIGTVEPLTWGLREVLDYHEVLLNRDDVDAKADAFIDFLADRVIEKEFIDDWGEQHRVRSFSDLERLFRCIFDGLEAEGRRDMWRTHHIATIRKVRNRLLNISVRCKGLVTDDAGVSDLPFGAFEDRRVYVLDVAGMDQLGQDLVFTRVVSQLREHLERRDLGVEHVVVFVDELNKYAPQDGPETYVRKMLLDISERGRYLGLVLFGAQQFRSQVHRRVVGNAGTVIFGRMDLDELSTPGYQVFSPATKLRLATLPKGELMVRHPHFTQPMFLRFPRPAVLNGRAGVEQFPPQPDVSFADAVARQLSQMDRGIAASRIKDLIDGRREDDVRRALLATRRARPRPRDILGFFQSKLPTNVPRQTVDRSAKGAPAVVRPLDDPYAS